MNLFRNLYSKAEDFFLKRAPIQSLKVHAVAKGDRAVSKQLTYEAETIQAQSLKVYKQAIAMATDPEEPDRSLLWTLYKNLLLDNHLASVIDSRILFCQRSTYKMVNEKGEESLDVKKLLERQWREDVIRLALRHTTEGTKLMELFEVDPVTGELAEVGEIPMGYFNAKKGIITKTPGDTKGWLYKEGEFANYYVQVGKNDDLGMLAEMAPAILAKKLGFGAWLDYIEKYGVGNLFITTDREDEGRLTELQEAARNFKSSGYIVGRGNEKFEIKGGEGGRPENFDNLITRVNDELSKRLLGGSGLTDEKSFVGSAEIQFRLAKDRFESDKLFVKNLFNQQIIPRLIKLSPVYAPLQGYFFEWDNSETQTLDEIIKLIIALAPYFDLDIEEISQKTGLKILGQKAGITGAAPAEESEDIKKKSVTGK